MADVILTQSRLSELLHYNPDTGAFTWKIKPNRRIVVGQVAGCVKERGYISIKLDGRIYSAHRLAWLYVHGEFPIMDIDHIDGNPSNNRVSNLRLVTDFENMQNLHRPMSSNKTSGILGVSFNKKRNRWVAQIRTNGVTRFLGRYATAAEASQAYIAAKCELHPTANYGS